MLSKHRLCPVQTNAGFTVLSMDAGPVPKVTVERLNQVSERVERQRQHRGSLPLRWRTAVAASVGMMAELYS